MKIDIITTKRVFNLRNLSEEEGLVLRTMLNMNDNGILQSLKGDDLYWNHIMSEQDALRIGIELRDKIFKAIDGDI